MLGWTGGVAVPLYYVINQAIPSTGEAFDDWIHIMHLPKGASAALGAKVTKVRSSRASRYTLQRLIRDIVALHLIVVCHLLPFCMRVRPLRTPRVASIVDHRQIQGKPPGMGQTGLGTGRRPLLGGRLTFDVSSCLKL
jgi:hypothetical protein